jgi:Tol biopolymer transport system component
MERAGQSAGRSSWRNAAVLGVVAAVALALIAWLMLRPSSHGEPAAAPLSIGTAVQATADEGLEIDPVLSLDGRFLAYSAGNASRMRIYIRPVSGGRTLTLSDDPDAVEYQPRFSPDGTQILYLTPSGAFVASAIGGTSRRIASGAIRSVAWAPDGRRVAISRGDTISIAPLDGAAAERALGNAFEPHSCAWAPSDRWIACVSGNPFAIISGRVFGNIAPSRIVLMPTGGGPVVEVTAEKALNLSPVWSADGRVLFFVSNREGPRDIYAAEIGDDGRVRSDPWRVTTGLGVQSIALSADGRRLAYSTYTARANLWSLPIPARGPVDTSSARALTSENQIIEAASVSRDGRWLLFDSNRYQNGDIFRMPIGGGAVERLTTDAAEEFAPDLSPDGKEVAYHSFRAGTRDIFIKPLDGGSAQQITSTPSQESYPLWSPKGHAIAYFDQAFEDGAARGLFVMSRDQTGHWSTPIQLTRKCGSRVTWTANGVAIACASSGSIIVVDVASRNARVVYAPAGPEDPVAGSAKMSEDGRTIYFKSHDAAHRASLWGVSFDGGKPTMLVRFNDPLRASNRPDFAVGAGQFFFTLEERQADIWVADAIPRAPRR